MKTVKVSIKYDPAHEVMVLTDVPEDIKCDIEALKEYAIEHSGDGDVQESVEMYTNDDVIRDNETTVEIDGEEVEVDLDGVYYNSEDDIDFINKEDVYCDYIQRKVWIDYTFELPDDMEFDPNRLVIQGINNKSYYYIGELEEDGSIDYFMWKDDDVIEMYGDFQYGDDEYLHAVIVNGEWHEIDD